MQLYVVCNGVVTGFNGVNVKINGDFFLFFFIPQTFDIEIMTEGESERDWCCTSYVCDVAQHIWLRPCVLVLCVLWFVGM
jgi:hypothetical protein